MSSPHSVARSLARSPIDFVNGDFDALALHMRHCARAQGRLFAVRGHLQRMQSLASGRIVTMACVAVMLGVGLFVVA